MIAIIDTGVANIRSLQAAFDRLQAPWELTTEGNQISGASHVLLPGVGAFASAMETIERLKIRSAIVDRVHSGKPTLCICLGMQLLASASEEAPGVPGLGVIEGTIERFPNTQFVPQLGWNEVTPKTSTFFESGQAYFANSFCLRQPPDGWGYATTDYGGPFISSIWKGNVVACQFHPELSGDWGNELLQHWLELKLPC